MTVIISIVVGVVIFVVCCAVIMIKYDIGRGTVWWTDDDYFTNPYAE